MKKVLTAALCAAAAFSVSAAETASEVKSLIVSKLGVQPLEVRRMPFGLWEISVTPGQVVYVDSGVRYLIAGEAVDLAANENLTRKQMEKLSFVDWKKLPKADAVKTVYGTGKYSVAVFADASCIYCKKLEEDFFRMGNVTVYTYIFPMKQSRDIARNVVCSKDPAAAWRALMVKGERPVKATCDDSVLDRNGALARKIGVNGTPTIVFPNGSRIGGLPGYEDLSNAVAAGNKVLSGK